MTITILALVLLLMILGNLKLSNSLKTINQEMSVITIKKDNHGSSPLIVKLVNTNNVLTQTFSFTDSCKYTFDDENQWDWNKLTGISLNLINARVNTVMCGWRYNPVTDDFELVGYYHVNGSFNPPPVALCTVKANEKFTVIISFDKQNKQAIFSIKIDEVVYTEKTNFQKFGTGRVVNTWFGGTYPAPKIMEIIKY